MTGSEIAPSCYWRIVFASAGGKSGFITQVDDQVTTLDGAITWMHSLGIRPEHLNANLIQTERIDPRYLDRQLTKPEWEAAQPEHWEMLSEVVNVCGGCTSHPLNHQDNR